MEGYLLTPPDRGAIIGRAAWKTRYVVVGSPPALPESKDIQNPKFYEQATSRVKDAFKSQPRPDSDLVSLLIYRSKDDSEPVHQHTVASISDCQVQMVSHRKQGPALPTLCVQIAQDPITDKLRKRRSSRTAGLTSTAKDSGPMTLWFRLPEDSPYQLADWSRYLRNLACPTAMSDRQPISPISPTSPSFISPFAPRSQDVSDSLAQNVSGASKFHTRQPAHTHASSRDIHTSHTSESRSLRSRRSDLSSSHASSTFPAQPYTSFHPSDLPSPATTIGDYQEGFIEGWTSAQGRSSVLSSPIRGRGSVSSSQGPTPSGTTDMSSSPPPKETILDRAFQMRYIPGSERDVPGEEKLSSLARFDALMRESENRRKAQERDAMTIKESNRSAFEDDDSDEEEDDSSFEDDDSDDYALDAELGQGGMSHAPPQPPQRTLNFLSHRNSSATSPRPRHQSRPSLSYHESQGHMGNGSAIMRPQTAHSKLRPSAQRPGSQSYGPSALDIPRASTTRPADEAIAPRAHEKRHSTSSTKRLSFTEFTKRLSSTSSLLLVQTNNSNDNMPGGTEVDPIQQYTQCNTGGLQPPADSDRDECSNWRGSIGVFGGAEGGLL